jgi:ubiquinone/menaquinone biosynthesis C-methylase UbiE
MSELSQEANRVVYSNPEVVSHYAAVSDKVTPCEQLLFDTYLRTEMPILDLGVGGGRTASYLSRIASNYVGIDYSEGMVRACRKKFPQLRFEVGDAADLSRFTDDSFDAVVFSFNGIDYLAPDDQRRRCLKECSRVLKSGGVFIFSVHNPRSLFIDLQWDRERLRALAQRLSQGAAPLYYPLLGALTSARAGWALLRSFAKAIPRAYQRLPTRAFWRGEGYLVDPAYGGLLTHSGVPVRVIEELQEFQFKLLRLVPEDYPRTGREYSTRWYYYAFSKD